MTCTEIQFIIDEIGDLDRLPPEAARHVDACRACERFGRELVSLRLLLREPGRMQAPADFDARLARRLRATRATPERRPLLAWLAMPRHGLAATAAAALLVVGGLTAGRIATEPGAVTPAEVATVTPTPVTPSAVAAPPSEAAIVNPPSVGFVDAQANVDSFTGPREVRQVRASATKRSTTPRHTTPTDAMILVSDDAGTHMVNVPAVLVGAEQILPTAGAASASAGVAF